jgi:hypothetical protein
VGRNAQIALAVGIGYLLGRRRNLRTALSFGAAAAVGRLSGDPQALVRRGSELLGRPQVAGVTKPLAAAGKAAAAAAVSHGIDAAGDRMRRKADALRSSAEEGVTQRAPAAPAEGAEQEAERQEAQRDEAPPRARPRAARPSPSSRTRRRPVEEETGEPQPPVVHRRPGSARQPAERRYGVEAVSDE